MSAVLEARIVALEARVAELEKRASVAAPTTQGTARGAIADNRELDSEYGDPTVKKDPTRWQGASYAGCRMSECPPDYLETLADLYDWMADKDDEQGKTWTSKKAGAKPMPASTFKRKDAARARGWARRNREAASRVTEDGAAFGGFPQAGTGTGDDEIPF